MRSNAAAAPRRLSLEARVASQVFSLANPASWALALNGFDQARRDGIKLDVVIYTAAIHASGKGSCWTRAIELLQEMCTQLFTLDTVACNACISACERGVQWQRALQLKKEMQEARLGDIVTLNSCISACKGAGRWEF